MHDVIVVGAGNAALAAAVAAREAGAGRVLALEKAPEPLRGGNTHYSGGLLRFAFDRAEDLLPIVPNVEKQVPGFMLGVRALSARASSGTICAASPRTAPIPSWPSS